MNDSFQVGNAKIPNPVGIILNYLFPNSDNSGKGVPDVSTMDATLGMTDNEINVAAQSADQAFAAVLTLAASAASAATAPGGPPFVAMASAAVGIYWQGLPKKEKASIWVKGGPIAQVAGQAVEAKAASKASKTSTGGKG